MSEEILDGNKPYRKSELESLMLDLIYLYKDSLPWSNILSPSDSHKLKKMKDKRKKFPQKNYSKISRLNSNYL